MMALLRCVAVAVLLVFLLPGKAWGVLLVDSSDDGIISIFESVDEAADAITISTENGQHVIRSVGNGLNAGSSCNGDPTMNVAIVSCRSRRASSSASGPETTS